MKNKKIKKGILFTFLLINLFLITDVYADSDPKVTINCEKTSIKLDDTTICTIYGEYTDNKVDTYSFTVSSDNLKVELTGNASLTTVNKEGNKVTLKATKLNAKTTLGTIKVSNNLDTSGDKQINITDIVFSNSLDSSDYNVPNASQLITVSANKMSSDNNLSDIKIDDKTIEDFSSVKINYTNIETKNGKIKLEATASDSASTVTGTGTITLKEGSNTKVITVKAENGDEKKYTLIINYTKEDTRSADNTLSKLELYNGTEKIDFTYDVTEDIFEVTVADIEKVSIKATPTNEKATLVKSFGEREEKLVYGENTFLVKVQAENEAIKVYTLKITLNDNRDRTNELSSLVVNGKKIVLTFGKYEYEVSLRYKEEKSLIEAKADSDKTKIEYTDIPLEFGDNVVNILVTAENGDQSTYKINIKRLSEEESKITLENIEIADIPFNFDVNQREYTITVPENVNNLNFTVTPNEDLEFKVLNNEELKNNSSVVVRVTDDDGERDYTFNIIKETHEIFGMDENLICYVIFGISVLCLALSIIVYIKKNKKS